MTQTTVKPCECKDADEPEGLGHWMIADFAKFKEAHKNEDLSDQQLLEIYNP